MGALAGYGGFGQNRPNGSRTERLDVKWEQRPLSFTGLLGDGP